MPPIKTQERARLREILEDKTTFATSLLLILLDEFGTEVFDWEPETLTIEMAGNYNANIPDENQDKIWSLITALSTNQFYVSFEMYNASCQAFMGEGADFEVFTPADPEDLAWGVTEVLLSDPPEGDGDEFSKEIQTYTGLILAENGILQKPEVLSFAIMPSDNPVLDLDTAFTDDPEMFESAWASQRDHVSKIDAFVKARLERLFQEISTLPLQNKDPQFMANIQNMIQQQAAKAEDSGDIFATI